MAFTPECGLTFPWKCTCKGMYVHLCKSLLSMSYALAEFLKSKVNRSLLNPDYLESVNDKSNTFLY